MAVGRREMMLGTLGMCGTALITDNLISGAQDGAIRALSGPTPISPDLATASAEVYRNLAIYSNVAR